MTVVPFGDWRPDDPAYGAGATIARNVYARSDRSYGPMTQWAEYSSALNARCQGGAAVIVQFLRQGIDRRILLFGRSDGGFQQLLRVHLANGHQPGECGGVQLSVGVKIHFSSGCRCLK